MELLNALQWRYATKKMNGSRVPEEKITAILEAARLAPTSSGLQPFEVIVISNPELKQQLLPIAKNQQQIVDSSHVLVFAAWDDYTKERIEEVFDRTAKERNVPSESMDMYRNMLLGLYVGRSADENFAHTARQAYIAFGLAIAAAAELKVDATPMEGFDSKALDELLGLDKKGLKSVTLLPLGYRDADNDWLVNLPKVRMPKERFITEYK
ncbi:nitroreductase family protein [Sediminibacterium ginsengisoli]|uniref:Nitroreductase n=1 Tax=Sediminibacterium ginsengisoli TaxID=413434 RepID=A0A1T4P5K3_9BACT|nr:nitroreductase family protein [Sediminibacterium ginsengisoli]SJZ86783.1 Nitroreductase [Sediminibacterium ginsengisoli]